MHQLLMFVAGLLVVGIAVCVYMGIYELMEPGSWQQLRGKKTELEQSRDYVWELYEKIDRLNDKITQIERLQLKELTTAEQWAILEAARQDIERRIDLTEMEIEVMNIWQHDRELKELLGKDDT
jgi:hypothetical protein